MESKFKIGDKVRVYVALSGSPYESAGIVHAVLGNKLIQVNLDHISTTAGKIIYAHPKQCRKLVKRPRQRVWVKKLLIEELLKEAKERLEGRSVKMWDPYSSNYVEFIEVKKK